MSLARSSLGPRRVALAVVAAFATTSAGWLAAPTHALAWGAEAFSGADEQRLVQLTNQTRAAAGLRTLKVDSALRSIARSRSKDMIERDYFSHSIPPSGKSVFDVMQAKGYCFALAGENIGWNTYPDDQATAAIHQMFLDSPGHRRNVVGKRWEVMAVGAYKGADGKKTWTVLFADKCGGSSSQPRATPKPKPRVTPKPTPRPARATPRPTARPTPRPTPGPTPTPQPTPLATLPVERGEPDGEGTAAALPVMGVVASTGAFRVDDPPAGQGLIESIVGDVAGSFFGA